MVSKQLSVGRMQANRHTLTLRQINPLKRSYTRSSSSHQCESRAVGHHCKPLVNPFTTLAPHQVTSVTPLTFGNQKKPVLDATAGTIYRQICQGAGRAR
eukprot:1156843-Pelagomonas_calceolata.AAC.12